MNIYNAQFDKSKIQKMAFVLNALEDGWSVKKRDESYIFTKKHENKKEIFMENYLEDFIISNMNSKHLLDDKK
jgi:hypothetical protein